MAKFNGFASYNAWNVSLWLNNDESLYRMAGRYARRMNRADAARAILADLNECGIFETPDGVKYTVSTIRGALVGM